MEINKLKMVEKLEDLCKIESRQEKFCRYSFYLIMNNINCPYFQYNINVILSKCQYAEYNKQLSENISNHNPFQEQDEFFTLNGYVSK